MQHARQSREFCSWQRAPVVSCEREFRVIHLLTATIGELAGYIHDINVVGLTLPERAIILAVLLDARLDSLKRHSGNGRLPIAENEARTRHLIMPGSVDPPRMNFERAKSEAGVLTWPRVDASADSELTPDVLGETFGITRRP